MAISNKLIFSVLITSGSMKDQKFTGGTISEALKSAQKSGFFAGTFNSQINGISFPLAACENLTALVKNKKSQWVLAPMKK